MNRFGVLMAGEIQRLQKYNILAASLVAALLFIGVLHFSEIRDVTAIFPLLIFMDATSMAVVLIGASMFFEREEGSIKTILVSPVGKMEYSLAKCLATVFTSLLTLILLYVYAVTFREINVNLPFLLAGVVLVAGFHALVGFLLTFYSRDFTGLLMNMIKYFFVFMIPVLLEWLGVLEHRIIETVLYAVPTKASMILLFASAGGTETWEVVYSAVYLGLGSLILFLLVMRKFDEFAARESGA